MPLELEDDAVMEVAKDVVRAVLIDPESNGGSC